MSLVIRSGHYHFRGRILGTLYRQALGVPVGGKAEKAQAEREAAAFALRVRSEQFGHVKAVCPTLREWWAVYEQTHLPLKSETTQARDRSNMRMHILPYFGDRRMDTLTKTDALGYLQSRRVAMNQNPRNKTPRPITEGTVSRERAFLQGVFSRAVDEGHLTTNVWKGIKRAPYKNRDRVLSVSEQPLLLEKLSPRYQRWVRFVLGTGCRLSEVRDIDPKRDIDWSRRMLTVTGKGDKTRHIPLSAPVVEVIHEQLSADGELWPMTKCTMEQRLAKSAVQANIPHISPHCLRHTFATRWLVDGGDIFVLSKILGHSSVQTTSQHYAHLLKENLRDAMDARNVGVA